MFWREDIKFTYFALKFNTSSFDAIFFGRIKGYVYSSEEDLYLYHYTEA